MRMRSTIAGFATLSCAIPAFAADPLPRTTPEEVGLSSQRLARIGQVLRADVEQGRLPGAVVAIARRGKLAYFEAFGFRDKAAGVPMTTDTIFSIASMTKPMTSVGALMLVEEARLRLNDPVGKYLPPLADRPVAALHADEPSGDPIIATVPAVRPMTIQDLFRHTSGLVYGGRGTTAVHKMYPASSSTSGTSMTGREFIEKLGSLPLLHQPGTVWDYSLSVDVLGQVIETLSEQTLGQYLQERLFKPLGMADTSFLIPPEKVVRYAKALPTEPPAVLDLTQPLKFECGGGCAASTAGDYLRFAQMLLNKGQLDGARILHRKTVELMTADHLGPEVQNNIAAVDASRAGYGFGLGVAVRKQAGLSPLLGSAGDFSWGGAYGTNFWVDPKEELAVVYMAHTPGPIRIHYRQVINALVEQAIDD
jgi:CubicO group peptidase (beta-lactamase class C family)